MHTAPAAMPACPPLAITTTPPMISKAGLSTNEVHTTHPGAATHHAANPKDATKEAAAPAAAALTIAPMWESASAAAALSGTTSPQRTFDPKSKAADASTPATRAKGTMHKASTHRRAGGNAGFSRASRAPARISPSFRSAISTGKPWRSGTLSTCGRNGSTRYGWTTPTCWFRGGKGGTASRPSGTGCGSGAPGGAMKTTRWPG
mmetsp:Transcript_23690/g.71153  ORF Transcript_23690/g.71153 Transcript_23690/m.71153 type:complete len:205 (-) Transcript_23690:135-749(-)